MSVGAERGAQGASQSTQLGLQREDQMTALNLCRGPSGELQALMWGTHCPLLAAPCPLGGHRVSLGGDSGSSLPLPACPDPQTLAPLGSHAQKGLQHSREPRMMSLVPPAKVRTSDFRKWACFCRQSCGFSTHPTQLQCP